MRCSKRKSGEYGCLPTEGKKLIIIDKIKINNQVN
jgi:hypothetical protein